MMAGGALPELPKGLPGLGGGDGLPGLGGGNPFKGFPGFPGKKK
jgi:signal recognition particle subunit SRP54